MKGWAFPFLLLLAFLVSGCVASSGHVRAGDELLLELTNLGRELAKNMKESLPNEDPRKTVVGEIENRLYDLSGDAREHANKDPGPWGFRLSDRWQSREFHLQRVERVWECWP